IVGGGQTGLNVAARFKQMNIPSIVIETNLRIGDNWRKRYPTLTSHTYAFCSNFLIIDFLPFQLLYQSYPDSWAKYTPRDKLADWLEQYPLLQLVVWTLVRPPHMMLFPGDGR
ncbi:hypothetical protein B0H10DRAFT_1790813, partial [Mycena sp. CBHHK59/15]